MKIHFYLRYSSQFGESFSLCLPDGQRLPMEYVNESFWHGSLEINPGDYPEGLAYTYELHTADGLAKPETNPGRHLQNADFQNGATVYDYFNPPGLLENVFTTQPFRPLETVSSDGFPPAKTSAGEKPATHIFRVKAPLLPAGEMICLLGHGNALRNWDTAAPLLLQNTGDWWETRLDLSGEDFPLG